jgi:hypothetical protein
MNVATTCCHVLPHFGCHTCSHCSTTTRTQMPSCRCSNAAMQCTSMQRELRTCSPECTIAAPEGRPNERTLCAEHGSLDEWHAFPGHCQHQTTMTGYPNLKAFKNTMGLLSKGDSRVASTMVWCDLTESTTGGVLHREGKGRHPTVGRLSGRCYLSRYC